MSKRIKKRKVVKKRTATTPFWWGYMRSRARKVSEWSPEHKRCLEEAQGFCAGCKTGGHEYLKDDHIDPIVPVDQPFVGDWNTYFDRLFNGKRQALCKKCHDKKTAEEKALRAAARKAKKLEVTEADLDEFAKRFPGAKTFVPKKDSSSEE